MYNKFKYTGLTALMSLLVLMASVLSPLTAFASPTNPSDSYVTPLIAGQNIQIGYVETWTEVINETIILHVNYVITDPDWYLMGAHLAVGLSLGDIPRTKTGNPIPGQFPYSASGLWNKEYEFTMDLTNTFGLTCPVSNNTLIYIATHADVAKADENGYIMQTETAWSLGPRFTNRGSWGMYFTYNVVCPSCVEDPVCGLDGHPETVWANGYDFGGSSWAMYVVYNDGNQTTDLIRGQNTDVGDVYIWRDGGNLVVRIVLSQGYSLTGLHIHVATSLSGIPQTPSNNPKIGNFEYQNSFEDITMLYEALIPLSSDEQASSQLYVAIHANIDTVTCTVP